MTDFTPEKRFSTEELVARATSVHRLINDLTFEDACKVINAVLTAKTEVHVVLPPDPAEFGEDQVQLRIENQEPRPSQLGVADGPELKEIPILVPNKLPVLGNDSRESSGECVDEQVSQSVCSNLDVTVWDMRIDPGIF